MRAGRHFHDFYAPVDGVARKFSLACDDGAPVALLCMEPLTPTRDFPHTPVLLRALDDCSKLLKSGLPWGAMLAHQRGDLGAVIEAAEARRAEIYGALAEAAT